MAAQRRKKQASLFSILEMMAAFCFMGVIMFWAIYSQDFKNSKEFIPIQAVCIASESYQTKDSDGYLVTRYNNTYEYIVEGKSYTHESNGSSYDVGVGNSLELYYDPANPEKLSSYRSYQEAMKPVKWMLAFAVVFQALALFALFRQKKKKQALEEKKAADDETFRREAKIVYDHFDSGIDEQAVYNRLEPQRREIAAMQVKYDKPEVAVTLPGPLALITVVMVLIQQYRKERLLERIQGKKVSFFTEYRKSIVETILRKSFANYKYLPAQGITEAEILALHLFNPSAGWTVSTETEDYVEGSYNGVSYKQSDVKMKERMPQHTHTIFSGRVGIYDYKSRGLQGAVVIVSKNYKPVDFQEMQKAEMENMAFNSRFDVYADSSHLAYYLLTPQVMEYILNLEVSGELYIRFGGDKVCILRNNVNGMFEPNFMEPLDIQLEFGRSYHELNEIKAFIDILNLEEVAARAARQAVFEEPQDMTAGTEENSLEPEPKFGVIDDEDSIFGGPQLEEPVEEPERWNAVPEPKATGGLKLRM